MENLRIISIDSIAIQDMCSFININKYISRQEKVQKKNYTDFFPISEKSEIQRKCKISKLR